MRKFSRRTWIALGLVASLFIGIMSFANTTTEFSDVPSSYWAYTEIQYITTKGLFNGTSATTFSPEAQMKRGQLAAVLYRYAGSPAVPADAEGYEDVTPDMYCYDAVRWCKLNKVFDDGRRDYVKIFPNNGINRGEFSEMLFRFAKAMGVAKDITADDRSSTDNPYTDTYITTRDVRDAMVYWAAKNGILSGTSSTTMSPADPIKRAHVAVMLYRYEMKFGTGKGNSGNSNASDNSSNPSSTPSTTPSNPSIGSDDLSSNMELRLESIRLTNEIRAENGVGELAVDDALMNTAQAIAEEYAKRDIVTAHDDKLEYEMRKQYGGKDGSNNLAMITKRNNDSNDIASEVVTNLKNSTGHFKTMIDNSYISMGAGAVQRKSDGRWFYVQCFGTNQELGEATFSD